GLGLLRWRGHRRSRLLCCPLCRLFGNGLTWLRISPKGCKRTNQLGYEKMRPLTSPLGGIDSVLGSQQFSLRLRQSLLTGSLGLNGCERLRSIATKERMEQIPARAWLHSIALLCHTQFAHAKLVSY